MKLFDVEVAKNVHASGELTAGQLVLAQKLDVVVLAKPLFEKIKELIPGHFEDGLLDSALEKLAALPAEAPSA